MKIRTAPNRRSRGYALLITLIFVSLAVILLMSVMNWTSQSSRLTDRNNQYYTTVSAAEAATEMALVHISRDYQSGGGVAVANNLNSYQSLYPKSSDDGYWTNFTFSNPLNGSAGTYVALATNWQYTVMDGQYRDLFGYQSTYRIVSSAGLKNTLNTGLAASVQQDIGLEAIPIFQFAVFYNMDMEMNPSPAMVVTGRVHANGNIYTVPSTSLTFTSDVTASGIITNTCMPGDPLGDRGVAYPPNVNFQGQHDEQTSTLNLPIGTNGTSDNVSQILQVPPAGESASSAIGSCRLYNKADLLVVLSDASVKVTSGVPEGTSVTVSSNDWSAFLNVTNIVYNKRESSYVRTTQFDIGQFRNWAESATNPITPLLPAKSAINIVYIADLRSTNATITIYTTNMSKGKTVVTPTTTTVTVEPGVELENGSQLPRAGLTVASPDPIYICGDYNTTSDGTNYSKGTNDTTHTLPAAVMADAVMVLSTAWSDDNSSLPLANRIAADTTINAAFLSGIVPTGNGYYSGGVENFPRFLENWKGKNFWYNGSMVVMFNSSIAKSPWGSNSDTYGPPARQWAFDKNFYTESKLPPGTPQILFVERLAWQTRKPGTLP